MFNKYYLFANYVSKYIVESLYQISIIMLNETIW